jgi:hypothetical protein
MQWYLGCVKRLAREQKIDFIFVQSDQTVFSKIAQMMRSEVLDNYPEVISILGGLRTLFENQKRQYKWFAAMGLKDWWVC